MKKLTTLQRVAALTQARNNAKDPDFKLVWDMKLRHLIKMAERGETYERRSLEPRVRRT